jgi:CubicO group peptidase (beta-lactamase class C family)
LDDGVTDNTCTIDTCLLYKADAGTRWAYHNAPYTLLDGVISNATSLTLNQYNTQKLKNPTGMTGTFVAVGNDNVYFSNTRSMARYGLLILNKGKWNNNQLMTDTAYFNQMTNTSQLLNKSYGYLWWLNGKASYMVPTSQIVIPGPICPNAPADMISAMGKDGQFLNVVPSQDLVWVRMGNAPNNLPVPFLLNDAIWQYVNNLQCTATGITSHSTTASLVQLFPNPTNQNLFIKADNLISTIEIYTIQAQLIKTINTQSKDATIAISDLPTGLFFVKANFINGNQWTGRFVKE